MRLGIFGGTFDPPHIGHIVAACHAGWAADLDEVWMTVASRPWQKEGTRTITDPEVRFRMVEAAIEGVEGLVASRLELDRGGSSYTVDTVEEIRSLIGESEISVIVGADAAKGLDSWERPDELRRAVEIIVVNRPGHRVDSVPPGWSWRAVEIPSLEVSGTDLRRRVRAGEPIGGLTPAAVAGIIGHQNLYV